MEYTEYAEKVGFSNRSSLFDYARIYTQTLLDEYFDISVDFYYSPKVVQIGGEEFDEPKALVFIISSNNKLYTNYNESSSRYGHIESIDYSNWEFRTYLEAPNTPLKRVSYEEAKRVEEVEVGHTSLDSRLDRLLMTDLDYTYSTLKANDKYVKSLNNSIRRYEYDID